MGFIQLLPALPDAWKEGSINGICAKGNFEVSISWKNNQLVEAVLLSKAGAPCTLRYGDKSISFKTVKGKTYKVRIDGDKLKQTPIL
ncbi:glycoside hydrolase family 95-like protein [Bacteroides stercorirosoris]